MSNNRVFHGLIERVGNNHTYQTIMVVLMCAICFQTGSISYIAAYLFYQDDYQCPPSVDNCKQYVCSLPPEQQDQFVNPDFSSLASRFGNYRCVIGGDIATASSLIYSGGVVFLVLTIVANSYLTMRKLLIMAIIGSIIGSGLVLGSPNLAVATVGQFMVFGCRCVLFELAFSYLPEFLSEEVRPKLQIYLSLAFGVGSVLLGLMFWGVTPWQVAYGLYQLLPFVIILVLALKYFEETPLEQAKVYTPEESQINGKECDIEQTELKDIYEDYERNQEANDSARVSAMDLFRYQSLRMPTILSLGMHMIMSYQFNGVELLLEDYELDFYLNGAILGMSHLIACVVTVWVEKVCPRKMGVIVPQAITVVLGILLVFWLPCLHENECNSTQRLIQTGLLFLYRFFVAFAYNLFYLGQAEFFPSQIRSIGMMTTSITMRFGVMLVPPIQALFQANDLSIFITFIISSVLMILFSVGFPQTLHNPPPEIIQELRQPEQQLENNPQGGVVKAVQAQDDKRQETS